ncbi:MAG: FG-GAP-like repeat-containing protein, partial [bacterium]
TFTKITEGSIVNDIGSSRSCAWGDYDIDGHIDLFVLNYEGLNDFLYHNNGDGTFTRIFNQPIVTDQAWGSCCSWFDYDNNGYLDLFVSNNGTYNKLFYNHGDGNFTVNNSLPNHDGSSYGFCWGDYDNDGHTDLFTCNVHNINTLYKNSGGSFVKVADEVAAQEGVWSVASSFMDYNNDGKLDLFVTNRFNNLYNYLYKNVGNTGNYVMVKLKGCVNKFGIGAKIKIYTGGMQQMKEVTSGSGWGSDHSSWSHFGLGEFQNIDSIIVYWPSNNIVSRFYDVSVNNTILVDECTEQISIVNINSESSTPMDYQMFQNFPNPFNPVTMIKYSVASENSKVLIKVYDMLGKEVSTLVDGKQNSGVYYINFNASALPSGVYYYSFFVNDNLFQTKKMALIK